MSSKPPPVPPASRSKKAPAGETRNARDHAERGHAPAPVSNTDEQGPQGNIHQNTTNQGYQQDR